MQFRNERQEEITMETDDTRRPMRKKPGSKEESCVDGRALAFLEPKTCCQKFNRMIVDLVLTTDEDKLNYLKNYNCMPPPIFILMVSIIELSVFIYYATKAEKKQWISLNDGLIYSPLIYDPYKREQAWRFMSYMLLHAGIEHIMGNILLQLLIGVLLEMVHNGLRVCIVYMSGVLAGSLASSMFDPFVYLVGASGGVYALLGGYLSNVLMNWSRMALNGLHLLLVLVIVVVDLGFSVYRRVVLYPDGPPQVSFAAHIAGGLAGITIGYVVFSNYNKKLIKDKKFWASLAAYLACCFTAVFWNLFLSPVGTV